MLRCFRAHFVFGAVFLEELKRQVVLGPPWLLNALYWKGLTAWRAAVVYNEQMIGSLDSGISQKKCVVFVCFRSICSCILGGSFSAFLRCHPPPVRGYSC